ncbi:MAG: dethiobiotin synthase [Hyphomicrobiaceae bacterium]
MSRALVVTGTDTGIGKTIVAALLTLMLDADYWKPIQSGLDGESDSDVVRRLARATPDRIHPEAYRLNAPLSPHRAAELDGLVIDTARLIPPRTSRPLVIEGAGGLLVPVTRAELQIDVFARWRLPVVLVCPTRLGCINHALLSVEALRSRDIPIAAIIFAGDENADSQRTIVDFARVPSAGRLPRMTLLDAEHLRNAASQHLDMTPLRRTLEASR